MIGFKECFYSIMLERWTFILKISQPAVNCFSVANNFVDVAIPTISVHLTVSLLCVYMYLDVHIFVLRYRLNVTRTQLLCGDDAMMDGQQVSLSDNEPVDSVTDVICTRTKTETVTCSRPCPLHTTC